MASPTPQLALREWATWSCADVCAWLETLGLGEYAQTFTTNAISGDILPELTKEVLKEELGISAFGHRVKIYNAVQALITPVVGTTLGSATPIALQPVQPTAPTVLPRVISTTPLPPMPSSTSTASNVNIPLPLPLQPSPPSPPREREANVLDLVVLHAAPLVIKDSKGRIFPMEKLDLAAERRAIVSSLVNEVSHKAIHLRFDVATADILRSLMTAWRCKVLHFSGHGLGQNPALCFEDGAGCTHMITPDLLRQLTFSGLTPRGDDRIAALVPPPLSRHNPHLQLVFVNSCHSQKVASVFLNAGIPHIIAVHSDSLVVDGSATMFAKHFYLSLFSGDTVRTAFEVAKGFVRTLPTQRRAACCCAHLHEPDCAWMRSGSRHSHHNQNQCCCKGQQLPFPHDESSKFVLLGGDGRPECHDVILFGNVQAGNPVDHTPECKSSIPSMHGQFIGRNSETYLMVKSLIENSVTACLGAPGIGKSSLIISVAHFAHSRRMFPDGIFYVDMEGQKTSTVRYAIAQTMGIPAADTDEEVFAELGSKRLLLVLDKVEELLDEDAQKTQQLLGKLISMAPNTRLLLASRRIPHIPNVTAYSLSLSQLPIRTATELLCLVAPGCSAKHAERLATICGCLPLAIRVVGRALANARTTLSPEQMIDYLERDGRRFDNIREIDQVGHRESVDRCIRSSICHLEEPLKLAFMALGFFRGSFDLAAVQAVLSAPVSTTRRSSSGQSLSTASSTGKSFFPKSVYARNSLKTSTRDDETYSIKSLSSELWTIDGCGVDNEGAMTSDSYDLLDLESSDEIKARTVKVAQAKAALSQLHQWSLVEFDSGTQRYRMHNLVQQFAEDEACQLEQVFPDAVGANDKEDIDDDKWASLDDEKPFGFPLGRELVLAWKRRFVRYYCMIVAQASHSFRFEGTLTLFDKERPNIESAMRLAHELSVQSIDRVREARSARQRELFEDASLVGDELVFESEPPAPDGEEHNETSTTESSRSVRDSSIVDALLYSNLVVRSRFIFRTRVEPKQRIQVLTSCLQLSRETRSLYCTCGCSENDPSVLLWEIDDVKYDRELGILDLLPSFEEKQNPVQVNGGCSCVGIRELIALEALLLADLGYAYCDANDWIAGEYNYLEALRLQREVLGWSEHAQVAEVLNQLGICLSTRWGFLAFNTWLLQHAERLLKGGLLMRKRVLGENHPEYATSLNNLANFYRHCGPIKTKKRSFSSRPHAHMNTRNVVDLNDAGSIRSRSESSTETLSDAGSESLTSVDSFASIDSSDLGSMDDIVVDDAEPDIEGMYRRSLEIRENAMGKNHPQVAQSLNNLALFLSIKLETSNLSDAEIQVQRGEIGKLFERALNIRRSTLGNASLETAATLSNIGSFKRLLREWKDAETHIKEALRVTERYFSEGSARTARMHINLARVYKDQHRFDEAILCFTKAKEIREQLLLDSREVGFCVEQIGKCMRLQGKEEEGKRVELQGRQLKRVGTAIAGQDDIERDSNSGSVPLVDRVSVVDVVDAGALLSRQFHFVGKLLGERGIHLKRIEAISWAQLRYSGRGSVLNSKHPNVEDAYIQIIGTTEQMMERARSLCIARLREVKLQWEHFTSNGQRDSSVRQHQHQPRGHHRYGNHQTNNSSSESSSPHVQPNRNRSHLHRRPPHSSAPSSGGRGRGGHYLHRSRGGGGGHANH